MPDNRRIPQTERKHPDPYQSELNPNYLEGQNVGRDSDAHERNEAGTSRETLRTLEGFNADELRKIPVLSEGQRLEQGATYVDLVEREPCEFTASADMVAEAGHAYVPKKEVPFEVWDRLMEQVTGRR
jgi:hypothetical protein